MMGKVEEDTLPQVLFFQPDSPSPSPSPNTDLEQLGLISWLLAHHI